jgi:hypothetical protein
MNGKKLAVTALGMLGFYKLLEIGGYCLRYTLDHPWAYITLLAVVIPFIGYEINKMID